MGASPGLHDDTGMRPRALDQFVFHDVFESLPEALVVLDPDGRELVANRAARELGLPNEEPEVGRCAGVIHVTDTSGVEHVLRVEERSLDGGRLLFYRDITERERLERELNHSRWIESLGYVTATVVHDLGNLLMPLSGALDLLSHEVEGDAAAIVADLQQGADRTLALVKQLLMRIKRQPRSVRRIDANAVVSELAPLISRGLPPNIELVLTLEGASLELVADRQRLETALLNLVANARDAMPRGGRITVATAAVASKRGTGAPRGGEEEYVAVAVSDTGVGVPPELRETIFERFFTTKSGEHGTGIGLADVRCFATEAGGYVSLTSEVGKGTNVAICLPRNAPSSYVAVR
jgi:signal transduction histidine kinase